MVEKLAPTSEIVKRWLQDLWLNTKWFPPDWDTIATLPGIVTPEPDPNTPEPDTNLLEKYVDIYQRRITQRVVISAVIDEPNFRPIDFLQIGLKQSSAICRISVYFSKEELTEAIQGFKKSVEILYEKFQQIEKKDKLFNSKKELKALFSPYGDVIDEIFKNQENMPFLQALKILSNEENIDKLAKINPIPIGTGFLVGGNHLLTNHHVIPNKKIAEQCIAQFYSYRINQLGDTSEFLEYSFNPNDLFISNSTLDYTLIQLGLGQLKRPPGYELGWIDLIESEDIIAPGLTADQTQQLINFLKEKGFSNDQLEAQGLVEGRDGILGDLVTIIQHPRGEKKQQIVLNDNRVTKLSWRDLYYRADTDYGSSGSPVFNMNWELVALTKKVIQKESKIISQNGVKTQDTATKSEDNQPQPLFKFIASQGTRICRIVEDLKYQSNNNPKLRNFVEDFVVTSEELIYPPLPAAFEFDGLSSYVNLSGQQKSVPVAFVNTETIDNQESFNDNSYDFSTLSYKTKVTFRNSVGLEVSSFQIADYSVQDVGLSPDGKLLAIALYSNSACVIKIWELDRLLDDLQEPLSSWNIGLYGVARLTFSKDSKILATSYTQHRFTKLWKIPDGTLLKTIKTIDEQWFRDQSFSSDNKFLATGGSKGLGSGKICIWSLDNLQNENDLQLLHIETAPDTTVFTVSFSPDNELLASGGMSGTVMLWRWNKKGKSLKHLKNLEGHFDRVLKVAFSPDGIILASAGDDRTVKLWNRNGNLLKTLWGHTGSVHSIEFNADNQTLVSASEDNTVKVWSISGDLLYSLDLSNSSDLPEVSFNPSFKLYGQIPNVENARHYYSFGGTKPFSLEAWINPVSIGVGGVIISKARGLDQGEYILYITKEGNVVFSRFFNKGTEIGEFSLITKKKVVTFGKFNHIAATYDGEVMRIYVNGEQEKRIQRNPSGMPQKDEEDNIIFEENSYEAGAQSADPYLPLLIGASFSKQISWKVDSQEQQIASNFFKGVITEVRIWNKALGETDIKTNMYRRLRGKDEELHQSGLIGYWKFEEGGQSSEEIDNINNALTNYPQGLAFGVKRLVASSFTALPLPFGLLFDGESNYVECAHSEKLNLTEAITVEAWVKHKFGDGLIVSKGGGWHESGYCLFWRQGRIRVELQDTQRQKKTTIDTKDYAPDDSLWHHIAFTWDRKSQEIDIYIDAQRQDIISVGSSHSKSRLIDGSYKNVGVFKGPIGKSDLALNIGRSQNHGYHFNGAIAEVRLWNTTRSQGQIKVNRARRLNKEEQHWSDLVGYWRLDDGGKTNTRVHNPISDEGYGEIKGKVRWFPEPPSPTQDGADLSTSET